MKVRRKGGGGREKRRQRQGNEGKGSQGREELKDSRRRNYKDERIHLVRNKPLITDMLEHKKREMERQRDRKKKEIVGEGIMGGKVQQTKV